MGNKTSTNMIQSSIENITTNVNKIMSDVTNKALVNIMTENRSEITSSCIANNFVNISNCPMYNVNIDINQIVNTQCISVAIQKIQNDTTWQKQFALTMQNEFADRVKNDNQLAGLLVAKTALEKMEQAKNDEDLVNTIKEMGKALTNSLEQALNTNLNAVSLQHLSSGDQLHALNIIQQHFVNKTYNETDIKNIVKNITDTTLDTKNIASCNLQTTSGNEVNISNCDNWTNVSTKINQSNIVKSLQTCSNTLMNNTVLQDSGFTNALAKVFNDTSNSNIAKATLNVITIDPDNMETSSILIYIIVICIVIVLIVGGFLLVKKYKK